MEKEPDFNKIDSQFPLSSDDGMTRLARGTVNAASGVQEVDTTKTNVSIAAVLLEVENEQLRRWAEEFLFARAQGCSTTGGESTRTVTITHNNNIVPPMTPHQSHFQYPQAQLEVGASFGASQEYLIITLTPTVSFPFQEPMGFHHLFIRQLTPSRWAVIHTAFLSIQCIMARMGKFLKGAP
jgi:hypothetical protein